jgi:predicted SAM-dependent methyltransferase
MKLHLGCGRKYKKGYINIDLFDRTVCDRAIAVTDMGYSSNSVELIEANQLLEHLGYVQSIYALSDWFRILKTKGKLVIETPDIDSSFRKYLAAKDVLTKKEVLNWIFGHETAGLTHLFCFNYESLKELLLKIGFENIQLKKAKTHLYENSIRVCCTKPRKFQYHQAFCIIRRKLRDAFRPILANQVLAMELEQKIDWAKNSLLKMNRKNRKDVLDNTFMFLCSYSPMLSHILFESLLQQKIVSKEYSVYHKLSKKLIKERYVQKEYSALIELNNSSKHQAITAKTMKTIFESYLLFLLGNKEKNSLTDYVLNLKIKKELGNLPVFSHELIDDIVDKNLANARKYADLGKKTKAKEFLKMASLFNSDMKRVKIT